MNSQNWNFKYFQIYREWEIDSSGVVPKRGRELNKLLFTAISITSKNTFEALSEIFELNLVPIFENSIFNKKRLEEAKKVKPLLIGIGESEARQPAVTLETSEVFSRRPWQFEFTVDNHYSALFIFVRFTIEDLRDFKNYTLDRIKEIDLKMEKHRLTALDIDDSYFWEFKKIGGDPDSFFQ